MIKKKSTNLFFRLFLFAVLGSTLLVTFAAPEIMADTTPPGKVTNLFATPGSLEGSVNLKWTSPGNDGYSGLLHGQYKIQYSDNYNITWSASSAQNIIYVSSITPGTEKGTTINGLTGGVTYYFRIWTCDDANNWSEISNGATSWAQVTSVSDITPPGAVTTFTAQPGTGGGKISLSWLSPGNDGYSGEVWGRYRIQYSENYGISWSYVNAQVEGYIWGKSPGNPMSDVIDGLVDGTTYYLHVWTRDDSNNWSEISNRTTSWAQIDQIAPGKVTTLSALTGTEHGTIQLSWISPGSDGYLGTLSGARKIQFSDNASVVWSTADAQISGNISDEPGDPKSYLADSYDGLAPGVTYYFRVWSRDASYNWSDISNGATTWAQNDTAPPGTITTLIAETGASAGEVQLSWIAVGDNNYLNPLSQNGEYKIQYSSFIVDWSYLDTQKTVYSYGELPGTKMSYVAVNLDPGVTYYFRMWAKDEVPNWSEISNGATAQARADSTPPGPITTLNAVTGNNEGRIELTWRSPGDDSYSGTLDGAYKIQYSSYIVVWSTADAQVSGSHYSDPPGSSMDRTLNSLSPGTTYYVRLWTRDESYNWSTISNGATTWAQNDIIPPANVNNLSALTGASVGEVKLTWDSPGDDGWSNNLTGEFKIQYSSYSGATWSKQYAQKSQIATDVAPNTKIEFIIGSLSPGVTYYFVLWTRDESYNWLDNSNMAYAYALLSDITPPTGFGGIAKSTVSIEWFWIDVPTNEIGYRVYSSTDGKMSGDLSVNSTYWIETNLSINASFSRYVRAYNAIGESNPSATMTKYTQSNIPGALSLNGVWQSSVAVQWVDTNPAGTVYSVEASTGTNSSYAGIWSGTGAGPINHIGLSANNTYYYRIRAKNGDNVWTNYNATELSTHTLADVPNVIASFSGVWQSSITVALGADNNSAGTRYSVEASTGDTGNYREFYGGNYTVSVSSTGLSANVTYYFRVRTKNFDNVWSAYNSEVSTHTLASIPNAIVFSGVWQSSITILFGADNNPAGTQYSIEASTGTNGSYAEIYRGNWAASITHAGLNGNSTFYYRIRAANFDGVWIAYNTEVSTHTFAAVPGAISIGTISNSSIQIYWGDTNSAGTQYSLEASTGNSSAYNAIWNGTGAGPITHSGLNTNTTYYYKVRAKNLDNVWTAYNTERSTHTLANAPGALTFSSVWQSSITITWVNTNSSVAGTVYSVEVATGNNSSYGAIYTGNYAASVTHIGISANTTYFYRVRAQNFDGEYTGYNTAKSTYTLAVAPGSITISTVTDSSVAISWGNTNPAGTRYIVEASTINNTSYAAVYSGNFSTVTHSGLSNNTTYYYRVFAQNFDLISTSYNSEKSTVTKAAVPGAITFSAVYTSSLTITWTNTNTAGTQYFVEASTGSTAAYGAIYSGAYPTSVTHIGLTANTTYYYRVRAMNFSGDYGTYNESRSTYTLCDTPSGLTVTSVFSSSVTINWNPSGNPTPGYTTYSVAYALDSGFTSGVNTPSSSIALTTCTVTGLSDGVTYYFRAWAINMDNIPTGFSAVVSTRTIDITPPARVTSASAYDVESDTGGQVGVTWTYTEPVDIASYRIYYNYNPFTDISTAVGSKTGIPAGTTYYQVGGLTVDTTSYYFIIVPVDFGGNYFTNALVSTGPVFAVNNTVGANGDFTIEAGFDAGTKVEVEPNTNAGIVINVIKPAPAKQVKIDAGDTAARTDKSIVAAAMDKLNDSIVEFSLITGQTLAAEVTIVISYKKAIDAGLEFTYEDKLRIFTLDETNNKWVLVTGVQTVDKNTKTVSVAVGHFSVYRLFATVQAALDLTEVRVYPNPTRFGDPKYCPVNNKYIVFKRLTEKARIRIFSVAGELVVDVNKDDVGDEYNWDMANSNASQVASGVYIYFITNPDDSSQKAKGRVAIIK